MKPLLLFFLLLFVRVGTAQDMSAKVLTISSVVGDVIDSAEKVNYGVLTFWKKEEFYAAQFWLQPDSSVKIVAHMKDGSIQTMDCTRQYVMNTAYVIDYRAGLIREERFDWAGFLIRCAVEVGTSAIQNSGGSGHSDNSNSYYGPRH